MLQVRTHWPVRRASSVRRLSYPLPAAAPVVAGAVTMRGARAASLRHGACELRACACACTREPGHGPECVRSRVCLRVLDTSQTKQMILRADTHGVPARRGWDSGMMRLALLRVFASATDQRSAPRGICVALHHAIKQARGNPISKEKRQYSAFPVHGVISPSSAHLGLCGALAI